MQFTLVVLQLNGEISDRGVYTHAEVRKPANLNVADGCHSLLQEKVPAVLRDAARFQIPIDPTGRIELTWRQPSLHGAMASFDVEARPAFTAVFLSGQIQAEDSVAARVTETFLEKLPWAQVAKSKIILPPDRPLTALTPLPPDASESDRRRIFLWTLGLSVAFFERAASGVAKPSRNRFGS